MFLKVNFSTIIEGKPYVWLLRRKDEDKIRIFESIRNATIYIEKDLGIEIKYMEVDAMEPSNAVVTDIRDDLWGLIRLPIEDIHV